jgi:hypothetical protein
MMIHFALVLAVLIATGQLGEQHAPAIENTIAGIMVGVSTLDDVQKKFGSKLRIDQGRPAVLWDGQCELFFDVDDEESHRNPRQIVNVQFLNLGGGQAPNSPCEAIKTGKGIGLSDSLEHVLQAYGKPTGRSVIHDALAIGYDNSKELCTSSAGPKEIVVIRNFGVDWSDKKMAIESISMGVTKTSCDEFREAREKP